MIWDPGTKRFYYAMDDVASATDNRLAFGFSKTQSPSTGGTADWCKYILNYGATFPDYPKLGDTRDFITIGVNDFNTGGSFVGSDIAWISKPAAGTACPSPATFHAGAEQGLQTPGGGSAFTPVGVNQTDTSGTGYAVAVNTNPSTKVTLFTVTKNAAGNAVIPNPGTQVTVPSYSAPPNIPQQGTTNQLDSLDRRLTQAVSGIDPGHANKVGIWTQHTVSGGAGAEVRWYEIDPVARVLLQSGKVTSASLYNFNGAISPNRAVNGTVRSGGRDMVLGFDTSSSTTKPAVKMVSKIGAGSAIGAGAGQELAELLLRGLTVRRTRAAGATTPGRHPTRPRRRGPRASGRRASTRSPTATRPAPRVGAPGTGRRPRERGRIAGILSSRAIRPGQAARPGSRRAL